MKKENENGKKNFKWWISHFRGVYVILTGSGNPFWYYLKAFGHYAMSQGAPC